MSKDYRNTAWLEFRQVAFSKLGRYCSHCSRDETEVTLQVHHKVYIDHRKPWEYNISDCEVLCSGCHAREHGHIQPDHGWYLSHSNDLGSLVGTCKLCGSSLRFEYHVFHNDWGEDLVVGTNCCDALTGDEEATKHKKKMMAYERFLKSSNWYRIDDHESYFYKNKNFTFFIRKASDYYFIQINKKNGKERFLNLDLAQHFLFNLIRSEAYLKVFNNKGEFIKKSKRITL